MGAPNSIQPRCRADPVSHGMSTRLFALCAISPASDSKCPSTASAVAKDFDNAGRETPEDRQGSWHPRWNSMTLSRVGDLLNLTILSIPTALSDEQDASYRCNCGQLSHAGIEARTLGPTANPKSRISPGGAASDIGASAVLPVLAIDNTVISVRSGGVRRRIDGGEPAGLAGYHAAVNPTRPHRVECPFPSGPGSRN